MSHGQLWTHKTHHNPDLGEATTFPHIVFSVLLRRTYIPMTLFSRTPKEESRNCLEIVPVWTLGTLAAHNSSLRPPIKMRPKETCSSPWELSNGVLHSVYTHRRRVDSRLLMVRSQTANLTLGPSFAHNLCCRCPNGSWEAIFDIYASRPFQRYKEHLKARCFDPCNWVLNFWES
jgi:hypothetical protein